MFACLGVMFTCLGVNMPGCNVNMPGCNVNMPGCNAIELPDNTYMLFMVELLNAEYFS